MKTRDSRKYFAHDCRLETSNFYLRNIHEKYLSHKKHFLLFCKETFYNINICQSDGRSTWKRNQKPRVIICFTNKRHFCFQQWFPEITLIMKITEGKKIKIDNWTKDIFDAGLNQQTNLLFTHHDNKVTIFCNNYIRKYLQQYIFYNCRNLEH